MRQLFLQLKISYHIPVKSWERIHMDLSGTVEGHWILINDTKTKWLEVISVLNTISASTITALRNLFRTLRVATECIK